VDYIKSSIVQPSTDPGFSFANFTVLHSYDISSKINPNTGTSVGGISSALVSAFASQNLTVFATARDISRIPASLSSLPNVQVLTLDVTSPALINAAVEAVKTKTGGTLDYLINNAGAGYTIPIADVDIEVGKKVFDVNFWGVLSVTKAFMPLPLEAEGIVVNISSVGALVHTPWIG